MSTTCTSKIVSLISARGGVYSLYTTLYNQVSQPVIHQ